MPKHKSVIKRAASAKRTKASQGTKLAQKNPYEAYRQHPLWALIDKALKDLETNQT